MSDQRPQNSTPKTLAVVSSSNGALADVLKHKRPRPMAKLSTSDQSATAALRDWTVGRNPAPPISLDDARRLAELEADSVRADEEVAVVAATKIARGYASLLGKQSDGYIDEIAQLLEGYHPDLVIAVSAGPNRVQLRCKFAPSPAEVKEALEAEADRRFKYTEKARLALALYAVADAPQAMASNLWISAMERENGSLALQAIREACGD